METKAGQITWIPNVWLVVRVILALAALPVLIGMIARRPLALRYRTNAPPSAQLYEAAGDHVQSFELDQNGLPATEPDWQLNGGFNTAVSIALDAAGNIYVSDYILGNVKVFAPGSSGNAIPIRVIPVPAPFGPISIAVNKAGYLFIAYGDLYNILVYAPDTGGPGSPTPLPMHVISSAKQVGDLVVDSSGRLYVAPLAGPIVYYNDPIHSWRTPDGTINTRSRETYVYAPMAIDETTKDLYFTTFLQNHFGRWQAGVHAARSLTIHEPDQISRSMDCNGSSDRGYEYSLAVTEGYLMYTCGGPFALFVYHKAPGKQRKVEVLPYGYGIVLWPDYGPISTGT